MSRFVAIWRTRAGSASAGGRSRGSCRSSSCDLSAIRGSISVATSRTASTTSVGRRWISNCPASMRATSSRSLTRSTSRFVERRITSRNSRCFSSSPSERDKSSTKPLIDVSGLRSSCDAVATNSDLSRSSRARSEMSRIVHTMPSPSISAAVTARMRSSTSTRTSPRSASSRPGSGESAPSAGTPGSSDGHELARARVDRRDRAVRLADDQRVAEALDRDREPLALLEEPPVRRVELPGHRVEGLGQVPQLPRPGRLDAAFQVTAGELPGGAHELVERPSHRRHEQRDQRRRAQERGQPGDRRRDHRRARVVVGLVARLVAALGLARGQVAAQGACREQRAAERVGAVAGGPARLRGRARPLLRGDTALDDLRALRVRGCQLALRCAPPRRTPRWRARVHERRARRCAAGPPTSSTPAVSRRPAETWRSYESASLSS